MPAPVAKFVKVIAGLSVNFTDSSANLPTSWAWNFGDTQTSTLQNPQHTYAAEGVYNVVFTAANSQGSDTYSGQVLVSLHPTLNQTIAEMVRCDIPNGIPVDSTCFEAKVQKWQLMLQPALPSPGISDVDIFNETKWPPLVNVLISKLVIYDYIINAATVGAIAAGNASSGSSGEEGGGSSGMIKGPIKKMETGPAMVEWFDASQYWSNFFKSSGSTGLGGTGGVFENIISQICGIASRVRIKLPMCTLVTRTPIFKIAHAPYCSSHDICWGLNFGQRDRIYECNPEALTNPLLPLKVSYTNTNKVIITHQLGRKPFVKVHDLDGQVTTCTIDHINLNIVEITFLTNSSGLIEYF